MATITDRIIDGFSELVVEEGDAKQTRNCDDVVPGNRILQE